MSDRLLIALFAATGGFDVAAGLWRHGAFSIAAGCLFLVDALTCATVGGEGQPRG